MCSTTKIIGGILLGFSLLFVFGFMWYVYFPWIYISPGISKRKKKREKKKKGEKKLWKGKSVSLPIYSYSPCFCFPTKMSHQNYYLLDHIVTLILYFSVSLALYTVCPLGRDLLCLWILHWSLVPEFYQQRNQEAIFLAAAALDQWWEQKPISTPFLLVAGSLFNRKRNWYQITFSPVSVAPIQWHERESISQCGIIVSWVFPCSMQWAGITEMA